MLPKIFIASPLFNVPQIEIIEQIEALCTKFGYDFYSARLHSGSHALTAEEKRNIHAWDPVFDSNEKGLDECRVMIAVLEYAMPAETRMEIRKYPQDTPGLKCGDTIPGELLAMPELPDAGTVWECGYHRAQGKLVLGFHTDKAKHLNLMLSHGCDGLIRGWDSLEGFLGSNATKLPERLVQRGVKLPFETQDTLIGDATLFGWEFTDAWDAASKEVE